VNRLITGTFYQRISLKSNLKVMDKADLNKLVASKSPRVTYKCNERATSSAWNDFVAVFVDDTFALNVKYIKCF